MAAGSIALDNFIIAVAGDAGAAAGSTVTLDDIKSQSRPIVAHAHAINLATGKL
jgi:hypothetical protein